MWTTVNSPANAPGVVLRIPWCRVHRPHATLAVALRAELSAPGMCSCSRHSEHPTTLQSVLNCRTDVSIWMDRHCCPFGGAIPPCLRGKLCRLRPPTANRRSRRRGPKFVGAPSCGRRLCPAHLADRRSPDWQLACCLSQPRESGAVRRRAPQQAKPAGVQNPLAHPICVAGLLWPFQTSGAVILLADSVAQCSPWKDGHHDGFSLGACGCPR